MDRPEYNTDGRAAAAAKSLQSCPTLCDPHGLLPTRLLCPCDSPGKNTGEDCHFLAGRWGAEGMQTKHLLIR